MKNRPSNQQEIGSLFKDLQKEIKERYGLTKDTINFIPFEKWRKN